MKKRMLALVLAMGMALSLTACGGKKFEPGTVDGDVYTNESVGITATAPDGLTFATAEELEQLKEETIDNNVSSGGKHTREEYEKAYDYDALLVGEDGSLILIMAEDVKITAGGTISEKLYLESMVAQCKMKYQMAGATVSKFKTEKIGGLEFAYTDTSFSINGISCSMEWYVYGMGDVMYSITLLDLGGSTKEFDLFMNSFEAVK